MIAWLRKHWKAILIGMVIITLVGMTSWAAYLRWGNQHRGWADWTGFGDYTGSTTNKDNRGKTLWDWMQLLIIPVVLALAAVFFNRQERKNELQIADDRNQDTVLQTYMDRMSELVIEKDLMSIKRIRDRERKASNPDFIEDRFDDMQLNLYLDKDQRTLLAMAQSRTITVLRQLNSTRRDLVFRFLRSTELATFILVGSSLHGMDLRNANISPIAMSYRVSFKAQPKIIGRIKNAINKMKKPKEKQAVKFGEIPYILKQFPLSNDWFSLLELNEIENSRVDVNLIGVDLDDANMANACLSGVCFREARMVSANLSGADLRRADLSGANLYYSDLRESDLRGSNLIGAYLRKANFSGAELFGSNLRQANLSGANVTNEQLANVKSLENATMPDGKIFDLAIHNFWKDQQVDTGE